MADKLRVGVLGATGMVGQRFVSLLADHPWFELCVVAASPGSAGKTYEEAVSGRWTLGGEPPRAAASLVVQDVSAVARVADAIDLAFSAVDMSKEEIRRIEDEYATREVAVCSNNSAHRATADVPMIIPELNPEHAAVIEAQRRRLGTKRGFVAVKPNCSLQCYVPALHPLRDWGLERVAVCTYQAISGAGKTFSLWPEMVDNVIPFIKGEEEKSEQEPLKIWGAVDEGVIVPAAGPTISAQCVRVPTTDGHMAAVYASFARKPELAAVVERWRSFRGAPQHMHLPSAPEPFLTYFDDESRPQTRLDRDLGRGMGVGIGRLRPDRIFDLRFVCLSHNTVRGAAGGAVLTAELLAAEGYVTSA